MSLVAATIATLAFAPPSRTLSIQGLRRGTDFVLRGVRFDQIGFEDLSHSDGPIRADYRILFPDGTSEDFSFRFDGFCAVGTLTEELTEHQRPVAVFRHVCGQDVIRVTLA